MGDQVRRLPFLNGLAKSDIAAVFIPEQRIFYQDDRPSCHANRENDGFASQSKGKTASFE